MSLVWYDDSVAVSINSTLHILTLAVHLFNRGELHLFGKSELFSALSSMCLLSLYSFHMFVCEWLYLVDVHGKVHTPD